MTARVLYWPTPAVRPDITSYVDENGFTFISPSPYVIFANVTAENPCGYQGSIITAITIAFGPNELSTWVNGDYNGSIQSLNFADFNGCPQTYNSDNPTSCLPYLAFGTTLASTFQPAWSTCSFRDPILPDPPFALIPASNLLPKPTSADPIATSTPAKSASYLTALPIETQSSTITPIALTTQTNLLASVASSPPPESDQTLPSVDLSLPGPSETTAQNNTINSHATSATATAEISIPIVGQSFTPGAIVAISGSLVLIPLGLSTTLQPAQITVGEDIYTANSKSNFVIGTQTYTPGATATINGTPAPIPFLSTPNSPSPSSAMALNLASSLPTLAPTTTTSTLPDPKDFTFAGNTFTINSLSDLVIGSQTITPGGVVTVSGTPISLGDASQADVVVGTSTQLLGSVILGMLNPVPSAAAGGRVNESSLYTGKAGRVGVFAEESRIMKGFMVMGVGIVWMWMLADS
ncbi:hypothetical protein MMC13_000731 [Lambiella insularis]|nr:hypothetical protein [Lambiella insularis]